MTIALLVLTFNFGSANGQDVSTHQNQAKLIKAPEANLPSGIELFGDTVNLYNGGLNLSHLDVSIPGNSKLPVAIGRRLNLGSDIPGGRQFGRWELDIPSIHTTVSVIDGWVTRDGDQLRCSKFGAPRRASTGASTWNAVEFWSGNSLYVPGVGEQRMLTRAAGNSRAPGGNVSAYPVVTSERWAFSCISNLVNGGGEGFVAVGPDGTSYRFDWMATYAASGLSKHVAAPMSYLPETATEPVTSSPGYPSEQIGSPNFFLPRQQVALLPTVVTDRFGNTVRYTYDPARPANLTRIEASDGRVISLVYGSGDQAHLIQSVNDGTRTWNYSYYSSHGGLDLDRVTLPDQSSWQLGGLKDMFIDVQVTEYTTCSLPTSVQPHVLEGTLVHPSGASATFRMEPVLHGRSQVPKARCGDYVYVLQTPKIFYTHSILRKSVSGPGLPTMNWQYDYGPARNSYTNCTTCIATKTVSVTDPEGAVSVHTFGNHFGVNEGKLLRTDHGWDGASALRSVALSYRSSNAGPYLPQEGVTERYMGDAGSNIRTMPQEQRVTTQQGTTLTWNAETFDDWARPLSVKRFSSLGDSRTEITSYEDNFALWVIGQVKQVTEATTGKSIISNTYDPSTALLGTVSQFGRLDQRITYHSDGTIATREDGKQQRTRFDNYKRGLAQQITYADQTSQRAVVNNIGKFDSITDANGFTTNYVYNSNGLLAQVSHPTEDSVAWNSTVIAFDQVWGWEYDFGPGHWRQTSTTGTGQTITYYDGLWRAVLTHTKDLNDVPGTSSMVKKAYDSSGNVTFTSFPKRNYGELGEGVFQDYDALERKISTRTNSELGLITTTTSYNPGFETAKTNGRGIETITRYRVYDDPTTAVITSITAPEGVQLGITRDVFDKPRSVTRSGHGKSATRSYVYDDFERLCKTVEPETGSTVQAYDAANNIAWKAGGLALPSLTNCDTTNVPESEKMVLGYSPTNQVTSTVFGDGSPSVQRTYTPDGLVQSVTSGGTHWVYGYNKRRLNYSETLTYGGQSYGIGRTYDANGSVASLTYPDQSVLTFNPNALGQERQVGGYASAIRYHPNGAIAGFTYGNGINRTLSQNARGLPERSSDIGVLNDTYAYDQNANVTSILDWHEGVSNRTMEYDGLDRLTRTHAPAMWGDAIYTYDSLDNITSTSITAGAKARQTTFQYASPSTNRLDAITGSAGYNLNYGYDKHGNVSTRGSERFVFDMANRMKEAVGKATYLYDGWNRRVSTVGLDGSNKMHFYSQTGQLLFAGPTAGAKTRFIYLNNHQIAEDSGVGVSYSHNDALGSPVARTNGAGAVVSRTRYEPFGLTSMGSVPGIGFGGHVNDADTGLVYMQQRYYDPIAGRMLSIDPVVTDANTGGSFNRYSYANNSPYTYTDPDGRFPIGIAIGIGMEVLYQTQVEGRAWDNLDVSNIIVAGAIGAVLPGAGGALLHGAKAAPKVLTSVKAINALKGQAANTVKGAKKLIGKLDAHKTHIKTGIAGTGAEMAKGTASIGLNRLGKDEVNSAQERQKEREKEKEKEVAR